MTKQDIFHDNYSLCQQLAHHERTSSTQKKYMESWRDIYQVEEVGVDSAAAVGQAVLELSERGVHRVLRGPPGPVRHYVDGLPGRGVPLGHAHVVVVLAILHRHRSVLGPRRLGHRRRRGRGRGERRAVQPHTAARPQRP